MRCHFHRVRKKTSRWEGRTRFAWHGWERIPASSPRLLRQKYNREGGDPEPVGQGRAVGGCGGSPVLSPDILCASWSAALCWVFAFISGFYKVNNSFSPGRCSHITTHGHLRGRGGKGGCRAELPLTGGSHERPRCCGTECLTAAAGKRSRGGTPISPGAPQCCLLLDCAQGSAGTGRRRWGHRVRGGPGE